MVCGKSVKRRAAFVRAPVHMSSRGSPLMESSLPSLLCVLLVEVGVLLLLECCSIACAIAKTACCVDAGMGESGKMRPPCLESRPTVSHV